MGGGGESPPTNVDATLVGVRGPSRSAGVNCFARRVPKPTDIGKWRQQPVWAAGRGCRRDLEAKHVEFAAALEPHGRSSMYDDLAAGRRMELDALLGEVVRRGARVGVPTPVTEVLYGLLLPSAAGS